MHSGLGGGAHFSFFEKFSIFLIFAGELRVCQVHALLQGFCPTRKIEEENNAQPLGPSQDCAACESFLESWHVEFIDVVHHWRCLLLCDHWFSEMDSKVITCSSLSHLAFHLVCKI